MQPRTQQLLSFALVGILVFALQLWFFPVGVDYFHTFEPASTAWQAGEPVFSPPQYLFNAPWVVLLLTPLTWMTLKGGEAALMLLTLTVMWKGRGIFLKGQTGYVLPLSLALCFVNFHVVDLLLRGQIDGFVLFGTLLMYIALQKQSAPGLVAGWFFGAVRPSSIALLWAYTTGVAYRKGFLGKTFPFVAGIILLSWLLFDWGWMWRWYVMMTETNPQPGPWLVTWWSAADYLQVSHWAAVGITLLILAVTGWAMARFRPPLQVAFPFLISASVLTFPYGLSYHYSVMLVIWIPMLLRWKTWLWLPLAVLLLLPLARLIDLELAWVDILLPLSIWLLFLGAIRQANYEKMVYLPPHLR